MTTLLESNSQLRLQWSIRAFVLVAHCVLFFFISYLSYESTIKKPSNKLLVRTVALTPRKTPAIAVSEALVMKEINEIAAAPLIDERMQEIAPPSKPEVPVESAPVKKAVETVKKPEKPIATPKHTAKPQIAKKPVAKPIEKKSQPAKNKPSQTKEKAVKEQKANEQKIQEQKIQEQKIREQQIKEQEAKQSAMIASALSSLDKSKNLQSKRAATSSKNEIATAPALISSLHSESLISIDDGSGASLERSSYSRELSQRLKLLLKLPEYGEVEVNLTLSRSGKVIAVKCLKYKSTKNARYLEKKLPESTFPGFGDHFPSEQEHTFHLHLSNELNW